ncbi:hypothetical protein BH11ACT6_BH11ACT6_34670 [soil metagenome]
MGESGTSPELLDLTHPPSKFCDRHPNGHRGKCGDCGNAREHLKAWQAAAAERDVAIAAADDLDRRRRRNLIDNCPDCYGSGRVSADEDGTLNWDGDFTVRCTNEVHASIRMVGNA